MGFDRGQIFPSPAVCFSSKTTLHIPKDFQSLHSSVGFSMQDIYKHAGYGMDGILTSVQRSKGPLANKSLAVSKPDRRVPGVEGLWPQRYCKMTSIHYTVG